MFVKGPGYFCDGDAVRTPAIHAGRIVLRIPARWSINLTAVGFTNHDTLVGSDANRRSVWTDISPEPSGIGHYATFPPDLPRICIQASTSEAGVCPICGAQWARVVEHESHYRQREAAHAPRSAATKVDSTGWEPPTEHTLGWRPTCACPPHQAIPAVVLDPFCGTGTTCLAAQRLGRRSIGVDLSEPYLQQASQRLTAESLPLAMEMPPAAGPGGL